ncbi:S-adenosyl-L-methionine-dependent methyltransferase [Aspergillus egyptiacus]|nr:S-adenosyl-L-methionine-dependent methyltransferase [Aspergillus egyptiacus]
MSSSTTKAQEMSSIFKLKDFASRYKLAEKVTGLFAQPLINQSGITSYQKPLVVLDHACGTGIISSTLYRILSEQARRSWQLTCGDFADGMVEYTRQRAVEEGWHNAEVKIVDAQETRLPSGRYTHVFASFAFPSFPDVGVAMKECLRILQPGGTIGSVTWKKVPWITLMKSSIETISPELQFPDIDEFLNMLNKGWNSEGNVHSLFEQAGFTDIQVNAVRDLVSLPISELVELNKAILPAIVGQCWTKEQRQQFEEHVPAAMQQFLEQEYGIGGCVPLEPTAIVATARKP